MVTTDRGQPDKHFSNETRQKWGPVLWRRTRQQLGRLTMEPVFPDAHIETWWPAQSQGRQPGLWPPEEPGTQDEGAELGYLSTNFYPPSFTDLSCSQGT